MTPRKEIIGSAELWLGDCRDVLPMLSGVDAVLTDQPYGSGWVSGGKSVGMFSASGTSPDWDKWSTEWIGLIQAKTFAAFCPCSRLSDLISAFGGGSIRFYIKSNPRPALRGLDAPSVEPIVIFPRVLYGTGPQHFVVYNGDNEHHPTQKPSPIMEWLIIGISLPTEIICDPFMGSGTTGVACARLGRRFVGVEIEPKYFDIACRRIEEAQRQSDLFIRAPDPDVYDREMRDLFKEPSS